MMSQVSLDIVDCIIIRSIEHFYLQDHLKDDQHGDHGRKGWNLTEEEKDAKLFSVEYNILEVSSTIPCVTTTIFEENIFCNYSFKDEYTRPVSATMPKQKGLTSCAKEVFNIARSRDDNTAFVTRKGEIKKS